MLSVTRATGPVVRGLGVPFGALLPSQAPNVHRHACPSDPLLRSERRATRLCRAAPAHASRGKAGSRNEEWGWDGVGAGGQREGHMTIRGGCGQTDNLTLVTETDSRIYRGSDKGKARARAVAGTMEDRDGPTVGPERGSGNGGL